MEAVKINLISRSDSYNELLQMNGDFSENLWKNETWNFCGDYHHYEYIFHLGVGKEV